MADETDILFKEVEDDLREDQAKKLWATYGKYFVGAAVVVVIGVAAFQGWKSYDLDQRQAAGETFSAAQKLVDEQKTEEALNAFSAIAEQNGGYAMLARFRVAALQEKAGDLAGAVSSYVELANDTSLSAYYNDMAVILGGFVELDADGASPTLIDRVNTLTDAANPWRHSAREILGLSALQNGDSTKAAEFFKAISDDATAPQGIKARASELLTIIGR